MGGNLLRLGLDLVERFHDRRHANRARARTVSAHAELHLVGIAMHDGNVLERDTETLRNELREGGLVPLPVRVRAGEHFYASGRVDAHLGTLPQADAAAE